MDHTELLIETYSRVPEEAERVLDGLDSGALTFRPDAEANSIAWLIWHLARGQDQQVADVAGTDPAWTADGWADRFGLPFPETDTGFGHRSADVAAVSAGPDLLRGYLADVHRRSVDYLRTVGAADLDRVVDEAWDPPVTLGARLVSIVADDLQHLGQAAYLRGLYERGR